MTPRLLASALIFFSLSSFANTDEIIVIGQRPNVSFDDLLKPGQLSAAPQGLPAGVVREIARQQEAAARKRYCAMAAAQANEKAMECVRDAGAWLTREVTERCNNLTNTSWGGSVSWTVKFFSGEVTYSVTNPTYEKCFNTATLVSNDKKTDCQVIQAIAMSNIAARCY